ncbi:MAG TPA: DUF5696 domain-containing protein [Thermoguttaceae bacterium]|nr:DUF5696 domain-containing protein [Thermoguttaceae bacterium]
MKSRSVSAWLLSFAFCLGACVPLVAQDVDPDFRPELVGVEFTSREVRPGDPFTVTIKFRNAGTRPARSDYRVFLHFEAPRNDCSDIVIHADHEPSEPTSCWQPGELVVDGPRRLVAPADQPEQEYFVHVGVYDYGGTGERLLESYAGGKIRVTREAPSAESVAPKPLSPEELDRRRRALVERIPPDDRATLQTPDWRFDVDRTAGAWALTDRATGVAWTSDPTRPRFGELLLRADDRSAVWRIDRFDEVVAAPGSLRLVTRPVVDGRPTGVTIAFTVEPVADPPGLRLAYDSQSAGPWQVASVRLLDHALAVTAEDGGCVYVPHRLGIELPAGEGLPGGAQWRTYDSLSMAMCGAVKAGSALLVNWEDIDTRLTVDTSWPDLPLVPGRRARDVSLQIDAPKGMCSLHPLGKGSYVQIAQAYRPLAKAKGWLRTWADKRKRFPTVDRLFGAVNFKPFVFSRVMPSSRFSDGKERSHLSFTFDEAAACAEHWRNDLGIDRASVVLAGWINGGYDVRHPDVLPAAPECGGNEGLADAAARIKACGYLFGMHDNYQDMYEDAASWDQKWLNKDARGVARKGGNWNGGQAWQVCAIEQVELAARKETNLPKIAELFSPTIYFIDTVFAWPLVTCEDPAHPMTRLDDLHWKSRLCLLAKQHFGLFGSEEGREWSVPCADYLEGIFGHQTDSPPGSVIPLFPLVYSDCVQIMTHQGNRIGPGNARKVADHVLFAEMPLPSFGSHLYWTVPGTPRAPIVPLAPIVKDLGDRKIEITYRWTAKEPVEHDYSVFVHFAHKAAERSDGIAYQNDHAPTVPSSRWKPGVVVEDGPHTVEVPEQYDGRAEIGLGMLLGGERIQLSNVGHRGLRYHVGTLVVGPQGIELEPGEATQRTELWSRGDDGWAEDLSATDRVIKNTWEVLSPLNQITAETPLSSHEFLSDDRLVQRTRFGDVTITVAYEKPAPIGDDAVPAYGFIVQSPTFLAFCATRYGGIDYQSPALFTARSLDGNPIAESAKVRIYHGFGDRRIELFGKQFEVAREDVVRMK